MLIDWFTVGAQAVNFLVLLWLMKRFLYKPILAAIGAREKRIADELAEAAQQRTTADLTRRDLEQKSRDFDGERAALLAQAVSDAAVERDRLAAESRLADDALRLKQQSLLQSEAAVRSQQLTELVSHEVFAIARQALSDLADADLEVRMVDTLLSRLRALPSEVEASWVSALKGTAAGGTVHSRFDLDAPSKAAIQNVLNKICATTVPLRFETAADSLCGIEVTVQGQKVSWTIGEYLKSLQIKVDALGKITDRVPAVKPVAATVQSAPPPPVLAPLAAAS